LIEKPLANLEKVTASKASVPAVPAQISSFVYGVLCHLSQELDGKLKIVKVEADPNPGLVEKYKVTCTFVPVGSTLSCKLLCAYIDRQHWQVLCVQVYGLPTLVVFKDGKVLDGSQREGAISEAELRKYLDKWEVGN